VQAAFAGDGPFNGSGSTNGHRSYFELSDRPDCFFEYRFFGEACFVRDEAGRIKEIK
jgi:hypothetical protein